MEPEPQAPVDPEIARAVAEVLRSAANTTGQADARSTAQVARHRSRTASVGAITFVLGIVLASVFQTDDGDSTTLATGTSGLAPTAAQTDSTATPDGGGTAAAASTDASSATASGPTAGGVAAGGPAAGGSAPSGSGAATGGAGAAPAATGGAPSSTGPAGPLPTGVTDKAVKIAVYAGDYSTIGAACPRCGNGDPVAPVNGLLEAWRRDKLLPVHGRDIEAVQVKFDGTSAEQERAACVRIAQQIKPFVVVADNAGNGPECPAGEFGLVTMQAQPTTDEPGLQRLGARYFGAGPTIDRVFRNFAEWSHRNGFLKDQVLGMFSPADERLQGAVQRSLRPTLKRLGYTLKTDFVSSGQQDEAVAVQRFRTAGVTLVLIPVGTIGSPIGLQSAAQAQSYHPKYLTPEGGSGYEMTDAVVDTAWNTDAMNGQFGMKTKFWDWQVRKPATPAGNERASYCLRSVQQYLKKELDVFDNDAQLEYTLQRCTSLELIREAMVRAGPNFTQQAFIAAMESIKAYQTSKYLSVSFGPGLRHSGGDLFANATFKKARQQPENNYWQRSGPWSKFFVE